MDATAAGASGRFRIHAVVVACYALVLVIAVAGLVRSQTGKPPGPFGSPTGAGSVSDVVLSRLGAPGEIRLDSYRGKRVVIGFFASWCDGCRAALRALDEIHESSGSDAVAVLGVAMNDFPERALAFASSVNVTFDLASDIRGETFDKVGARAMPTTLFVGRDGLVLERVSGPISKAAIEARLHKPPR